MNGLRSYIILASALCILVCHQNQIHAQKKTYIEVVESRLLDFGEDIGKIRFFDKEIVKTTLDTKWGKHILIYGKELEIIRSRTLKPEVPPKGLNYNNLNDKSEIRPDSLETIRPKLDSILKLCLSTRIINGIKLVQLDLEHLDKEFEKLKVYLANKVEAKIILDEKRKASIEYDRLDSVVRVIPFGYTTLYVARNEIATLPAENDTSKFEELKTEGDISVLKDLRNPGKYYKSGEGFKPERLPVKDYKLANGKKLVYRSEKWQELDGFPISPWLIIPAGGLAVVGILWLIIFKFGKIHFVRHPISQSDSLERLSIQYSLKEGEEHRLKKRRIIQHNQKLLEGFDPQIDYDKSLLRKNPDLEGKVLIIPVSKWRYQKYLEKQSNDMPHRDTEQGSSIQDSAPKRDAARENYRTNRPLDMPGRNDDILSKLNGLESKLDTVIQGHKQEALKAIENENESLKSSINELEKELGLTKEDLQDKTGEYDQLIQSYRRLKENHDELTEESQSNSASLQRYSQTALFFTREGNQFARNRKLVLRNGVRAWEELNGLFNECHSIQHSEDESRGLGQIIYKSELLDHIMNVSSCLSDLARLEESGIWTNPDHVRKLRKEEDENARLGFIDKSLNQEVIAPFLGRLMVALEEARCLEKILVKKSDILNRVGQIGQKLYDIKKSADELVGIEIDYVPLFSSVSEHTQVRATERPPSGLYANLQLKKDHILEIESYGLKFSGQSTFTKVIIKR